MEHPIRVRIQIFACIKTKNNLLTNKPINYFFLCINFLHLFSFNLPMKWANLSEKETLHCAISMRNGLRALSNRLGILSGTSSLRTTATDSGELTIANASTSRLGIATAGAVTTGWL
jgi:hypothetical protein